MALLCWSCTKIKGKRSCPAHAGAPICPRCCGTKRRTEIRCPEDCPFLHGEHDPRWEPSSKKEEEALFIAHFAAVPRERIPLLVFLHHLLIEAQQNHTGALSDPDTLEIVTTLARTFETRSKGILYEHKTESPRLQAAVRWMGTVLERRGGIPHAPKATDAEVSNMLQTIAASIRSHRESAKTVKSYLDTAARVFRASLAETPRIETPPEASSGGLIVEP